MSRVIPQADDRLIQVMVVTQNAQESCLKIQAAGFEKRAVQPSAWRGYARRAHSLTRFSNCALIATTTVLADMSTAPMAGVSRMPHVASTPAARGIAKML